MVNTKKRENNEDVKLDDDSRTEFPEPCFKNIRHLYKTFGAEKFHMLAHHVVTGNQIVIRSGSESLTRSMISSLKVCFVVKTSMICVRGHPFSTYARKARFLDPPVRMLYVSVNRRRVTR